MGCSCFPLFSMVIPRACEKGLSGRRFSQRSFMFMVVVVGFGYGHFRGRHMCVMWMHGRGLEG